MALAAGPAPIPDIAALTGADGTFEISVPAPGTYRVAAFTDTGSATADVLVAPGARASADLTV